MVRIYKLLAPLGGAIALAACASSAKPTTESTSAGVTAAPDAATLDKDNPVKPLPEPPLGIDVTWEDLTLKAPITAEKVRLGRWLFFDKRLSADNTVACSSCHQPEHAFSEPTPVSTGIGGQKGGRKAPSFTNMHTTLYPHFFWDGRAASLEEQALGPVQNPIEMGNSLDGMLDTLRNKTGYAKYFEQAFGTAEITPDRVAEAIASYERTRLSGNSPYDKWKQDGDEAAVSDQAKKGWELFHGKAECNQCHLGENFTDASFHNLGIGWDAAKKALADEGRSKISGKAEDAGAFKTPGLRDITKHAPYMHDGSIATLKEVVQHYNKGGNPNPTLSPKIRKLDLTDEEVDAIVAFMQALDGEGYQDTAPASFP